MTKQHLLSSLMLLLALVTNGAWNKAWATEYTVTYKVSSKTAVTTTGTAPTGSSATFKNTGSNNDDQMTGGNSETLTLSGFNGYKLTNLKLSMHSNKSAGAGKLSYSSDGGTNYTYLVGSSNAGVAFNQSAWYGNWSQSFVDITKDLNITATEKDIIIKIEATANSLYCQSFTITYEDNKAATTTTLDQSTLTLAANGTTATLTPTVKAGETAISGAAVTWTSSNEDVATVEDGVVTAHKIGTATITAAYAGDDDYQASSATCTVTVEGIPAATITALNIAEVNVGDDGTLSATYTKASDDVDVTVSYASSNNDVLMVEGTEYLAITGGTVTVTVTVTPTTGLDYYVAATKDFTVTVLNTEKGTTTLTLYDESVEVTNGGTTVYGTAVELLAGLATNYDGTITYTSSNDYIAEVSIAGEEITITPKAVGITTITFTAPETANFEGTVNAVYALTVTAPEAQTTASVTTADVKLDETFDKCEGNGGNDNTWSGMSNSTNISDTNTDVSGWSGTNAKAASACASMGTASAKGSITTPALNLESDKTYTLRFKAGAWSADNAGMTLSISTGKLSQTSFTLSKGSFTEYTVTITEGSSTSKVTFAGNGASKYRFFLDEVWVGIPGSAPEIPAATIAKSGYGTYCCEYPLDFTETNEAYTVWTVESVDLEQGTVKFAKLDGKTVKGGTPVILYGTTGTYQLTVATEGTDEPTTLLKGTLAPTYIESTETTTNFGLSNGQFVPLKDGVVKANKAYLAVPAEATARSLRIVFDGQTTAISTTTTQRPADAAYYDLQGRQIVNSKSSNSKLAKGLYIQNGRKVLVK